MTFDIQTLYYRAPELLLGNQDYSIAIDMWSLGCVIAEMALGKPLFNGQSEIEMIFSILNQLGSESIDNSLKQSPFFSDKFPKFKRKLHETLHNKIEVLRFVEPLLQLNPEKRPTARQML